MRSQRQSRGRRPWKILRRGHQYDRAGLSGRGCWSRKALQQLHSRHPGPDGGRHDQAHRGREDQGQGPHHGPQNRPNRSQNGNCRDHRQRSEEPGQNHPFHRSRRQKKTASVTATAGHPFWVPELGDWVNAAQLIDGERLSTSARAVIQITNVDQWTQPATVYNLTVADIHTYYVLAGQTPVLVPNSNGCVNWASNSVKTWGHTFKTHGAGAKNTKALTDHARSTGNQQGQWLDNDAAADFLKGLHVEGAGPRSVQIPEGMGQVIMPDGSIVQARAATVVPSPNGLHKTGFPIIGPN